MDPLTWTGSLGTFLDPALLLTAIAFAVTALLSLLVGYFAPPVAWETNPDGTLTARTGLRGLSDLALRVAMAAFFAVLAGYIIGGILMPYGSAGIVGAVAKQFLPVWLALVATFVLSIRYRRRLGLYGKLFDSTVGMVGFGLVMFWVFTAIAVGVFGLIATHDPSPPFSAPSPGARAARCLTGATSAPSSAPRPR